jgi:hypothetical protein
MARQSNGVRHSDETLFDVCHWLCQCPRLPMILHWQSQWHTKLAKMTATQV